MKLSALDVFETDVVTVRQGPSNAERYAVAALSVIDHVKHRYVADHTLGKLQWIDLSA